MSNVGLNVQPLEPVSTLDMSASSTAISFHVDGRASATVGCRQVATLGAGS